MVVKRSFFTATMEGDLRVGGRRRLRTLAIIDRPSAAFETPLLVPIGTTLLTPIDRSTVSPISESPIVSWTWTVAGGSTETLVTLDASEMSTGARLPWPADATEVRLTLQVVDAAGRDSFPFTRVIETAELEPPIVRVLAPCGRTVQSGITAPIDVFYSGPEPDSFQLEVQYTDPGGVVTEVEFQQDELPFELTPQLGRYDIRATASAGGQSAVDTCSFTVDNVVRPPIVQINVASPDATTQVECGGTVDVGDTLVFDVYYAGNELNTLSLQIDFTDEGGNTSTNTYTRTDLPVSLTTTAQGNYVATANATDVNGLTGSALCQVGALGDDDEFANAMDIVFTSPSTLFCGGETSASTVTFDINYLSPNVDPAQTQISLVRLVDGVVTPVPGIAATLLGTALPATITGEGDYTITARAVPVAGADVSDLNLTETCQFSITPPVVPAIEIFFQSPPGLDCGDTTDVDNAVVNVATNVDPDTFSFEYTLDGGTPVPVPEDDLPITLFQPGTYNMTSEITYEGNTITDTCSFTLAPSNNVLQISAFAPRLGVIPCGSTITVEDSLTFSMSNPSDPSSLTPVSGTLTFTPQLVPFPRDVTPDIDDIFPLTLPNGSYVDKNGATQNGIFANGPGTYEYTGTAIMNSAGFGTPITATCSITIGPQADRPIARFTYLNDIGDTGQFGATTSEFIVDDDSRRSPVTFASLDQWTWTITPTDGTGPPVVIVETTPAPEFQLPVPGFNTLGAAVTAGNITLVVRDTNGNLSLPFTRNFSIANACGITMLTTMTLSPLERLIGGVFTNPGVHNDRRATMELTTIYYNGRSRALEIPARLLAIKLRTYRYNETDGVGAEYETYFDNSGVVIPGGDPTDPHPFAFGQSTLLPLGSDITPDKNRSYPFWPNPTVNTPAMQSRIGDTFYFLLSDENKTMTPSGNVHTYTIHPYINTPELDTSQCIVEVETILSYNEGQYTSAKQRAFFEIKDVSTSNATPEATTVEYTFDVNHPSVASFNTANRTITSSFPDRIFVDTDANITTTPLVTNFRPSNPFPADGRESQIGPQGYLRSTVRISEQTITSTFGTGHVAGLFEFNWKLVSEDGGANFLLPNDGAVRAYETSFPNPVSYVAPPWVNESPNVGWVTYDVYYDNTVGSPASARLETGQEVLPGGNGGTILNNYQLGLFVVSTATDAVRDCVYQLTSRFIGNPTQQMSYRVRVITTNTSRGDQLQIAPFDEIEYNRENQATIIERFICPSLKRSVDVSVSSPENPDITCGDAVVAGDTVTFSLLPINFTPDSVSFTITRVTGGGESTLIASGNLLSHTYVADGNFLEPEERHVFEATVRFGTETYTKTCSVQILKPNCSLVVSTSLTIDDQFDNDVWFAWPNYTGALGDAFRSRVRMFVEARVSGPQGLANSTMPSTMFQCRLRTFSYSEADGIGDEYREEFDTLGNLRGFGGDPTNPYPLAFYTAGTRLSHREGYGQYPYYPNRQSSPYDNHVVTSNEWALFEEKDVTPQIRDGYLDASVLRKFGHTGWCSQFYPRGSGSTIGPWDTDPNYVFQCIVEMETSISLMNDYGRQLASPVTVKCRGVFSRNDGRRPLTVPMFDMNHPAVTAFNAANNDRASQFPMNVSFGINSLRALYPGPAYSLKVNDPRSNLDPRNFFYRVGVVNIAVNFNRDELTTIHDARDLTNLFEIRIRLIDVSNPTLPPPFYIPNGPISTSTMVLQTGRVDRDNPTFYSPNYPSDEWVPEQRKYPGDFGTISDAYNIITRAQANPGWVTLDQLAPGNIPGPNPDGYYDRVLYISLRDKITVVAPQVGVLSWPQRDFTTDSRQTGTYEVQMRLIANPFVMARRRIRITTWNDVDGTRMFEAENDTGFDSTYSSATLTRVLCR